MIRLIISLTMPVILVALAGCADSQRFNPMDQKQILVFSGFTVRVADSSASLEQLGRLPQRQLLRYESGEEPLYIWVDAAGCGCWYTGDSSAYRRLLEMGWAGGRPS